MNEIEFDYTPDDGWMEFYKGDWNVAVLIGGRAGMKTWNAGNFVALETHKNPEYRTLVLRDVATTIEQSILQNIKDRFRFINDKAGGIFERVFEIQENQIKNKVLDQVILFTKGFRKSRVLQQADLKGFENIDLAILEEAEDLRDEERVNTLLDTLRKEGHKVIIILNTPDTKHWIIKRYFNLIPSEYEGYFYPVPKQIKGVFQKFTTYKDNKHLPQQTIDRYNSYGDPDSHLYNPDYYASKILGLATSGRFGQVFKHFKHCTLDQYNEIDYTPWYGLDFGFTNDPTALVECKSHNNTLYTRQLIYERGMTNQDIFNRLISFGLSNNSVFYCDSAEPKSIEELNRLARQKNNGWMFESATKGSDSVNAGIQYINSLELFVLDTSSDMLNELENYVYALDRNKEPTNTPIDSYNHSMDALRYAVFSHLFNQKEELLFTSFFT